MACDKRLFESNVVVVFVALLPMDHNNNSLKTKGYNKSYIV